MMILRLICILFCYLPMHENPQIHRKPLTFSNNNFNQVKILLELNEGDTLYINYFIAHGELGGVNEGIWIHKKENKLNATHIRFNSSSYKITTNEGTLISFYKSSKHDYITLKKDFILTGEQIEYLGDFLIELETYEPKGFSNAVDHYAVLSKKKDFVLIDWPGTWNKYLELKKVLGLDK